MTNINLQILDFPTLVNQIHVEAEDRRKKGEDKDPLMAMDEAIQNGENILHFEAMTVLVAHQQGPWAIRTTAEMNCFAKWCERCGSPLAISTNTDKLNG